MSLIEKTSGFNVTFDDIEELQEFTVSLTIYKNGMMVVYDDNLIDQDTEEKVLMETASQINAFVKYGNKDTD